MAAARSGGLPVEVVGTFSANLVEPCEEGAPELERPPAPPEEPALALSFSGGGWRAALTASGALRFVADAGLLGRVRWLSSVSGGSITNALFAVAYEEVRGRGFTAEALDERVLRPLLGAARDRSLSWALVRNAWRAIGPRTRTDVLADLLDGWVFGGRLLSELTDEVRFVFNAANATTGVRFGFERQRVGDYVLGQIPTGETTLRVADAVAASAAVPGAFAAVRLRGLAFPCGEGADARLLDGGVYDNLGLEAIDELRGPCLIAVSAGGVLRTGQGGAVRFVPVIRDLKRSSSLLYRQATTLRTRSMVERFRAWERTPPGEEPPEWARRGVLFGLATTMDEDNPRWRNNSGGGTVAPRTARTEFGSRRARRRSRAARRSSAASSSTGAGGSRARRCRPFTASSYRGTCPGGAGFPRGHRGSSVRWGGGGGGPSVRGERQRSTSQATAVGRSAGWSRPRPSRVPPAQRSAFTGPGSP